MVKSLQMPSVVKYQLVEGQSKLLRQMALLQEDGKLLHDTTYNCLMIPTQFKPINF